MRAPFFLAYARGYGGLPLSEFAGAMEGEGASFQLDHPIQGVLRFESENDGAIRAASRLSLSRFVCGELCCSSGDPRELMSEIRKGINLPEFGSFKLLVRRIGASVPPEAVGSLARDIGGEVAEVTHARVDMENPERVLVLLVADGGYVLGVKLAETSRRMLPSRGNELKPFSHYSALQPEFCRVLANLARAKPRSLVLDPFCGTGGIMIEACDLGATSLGLDFRTSMTRGARTNLMYFRYDRFHLVTGDIRDCPFTNADSVATDPPYGKLSPMVKGRSVSETYQDLMALSRDILPPGGHLSLVCPSDEPADMLIREAGFTLLSKDEIRVHDSLTRSFLAARR